MPNTAKPPQFHVAFDTNCLFTEAADKLFSLEISDFIQYGSKTLGLDVIWYLPPVVKAERNYQMLERAKGLLPNLLKLERLLGHGLNINEQVLADRVRDAIAHQITAHGVTELTIDPTQVDWNELIDAAAFRRPPFDPGEKEKGFRDALILEAFTQLVAKLPKSNSTARIILLTNDGPLQDAARQRFENHANVSVARNLGELRTALNAVASQITQDVIAAVIPRAQNLFFQKEKKQSLYYKSDLWDKIWSEFSSIIRKGPEEGITASVEQIQIDDPTFLEKQNQRLCFSTNIVVEVEAVKIVPRPSPSPSATVSAGTISPGVFGITHPSSATSVTNLGLGGLAGISASNTLSSGLSAAVLSLLTNYSTIKRYGSHTFRVSWTATLTKTGNLINPKVGKIEYLSSSWED